MYRVAVWPLCVACLLALVLWAHPGRAQTVQTIRGTVRDAETLEPLPFANVVVIDLPTPLGTPTDSLGRFVLQGVPTGRHNLQISFVGYESQTRNGLVLTAGKELLLDVKLELSTHGGVVITALQNNGTARDELNSVSGRQLSIDETNRFAGTLNDPARMAANYAGVASANDGRNDIVVRGNSPSGILWRLEGLDIGNPNHFATNGSTGGPVSIVNNNTLDNSDFLTSAFPAQYGNATSGVFDLSLRPGNPGSGNMRGRWALTGWS